MSDWDDIPSLKLRKVYEFYNYDEFKDRGYVSWEEFFPRPVGSEHDTVYCALVLYSYAMQKQSLDTIDLILNNNVAFSKWTSFVGIYNSNESDDFLGHRYACFVFATKEDITLFKMFSKIERTHYFCCEGTR